MFAILKEYSLNVFYKDDMNPLDETVCIQPSVYMLMDNGTSTRTYFQAFTLTLAESRAIMPDFPQVDWGTDFFIGLEPFYVLAKAIPQTLADTLAELPDVETIDNGEQTNYTKHGEVKWLPSSRR